MLIFTLFIYVTLTVIIYINSQWNIYTKDIIKFTCLTILTITVLLFVLFFITRTQYVGYNLLCLIPIPLFIYCYILIKKITHKTNYYTIQPNQQSYNNINAEDIKKFYEYRSVLKNKIREIKIEKTPSFFLYNSNNNNTEPNIKIENTTITEKFINHTIQKNKYYSQYIKPCKIDYKTDTKFLNPQIFINLEKIKLEPISNDIIDKIQYLKDNSQLYKYLLNIIESHTKEYEINFNPQELLEKNHNIPEIFIMDAFETYTKPLNFGIANLDLLAQNEQEEELVYALDSLILSNIKFKGCALFYIYSFIKGRTPTQRTHLIQEEEQTA